MFRDVTELLRVDPNAADTPKVDVAVDLIRAGRHVTVTDDTHAVDVLVALGLPFDDAKAQVSASHGTHRAAPTGL